jgi:integrase/recombinase XerD
MGDKYAWKSGLADQMQMFLTLKRMSGFTYEREGKLMEKFDQYCCETEFPGQALTRELVDGFCYGIDYEKATTRYNKEKLLIGFAKYLCGNGYESYICPKISAPRKKVFEPYIFSEVELNRVF